MRGSDRPRRTRRTLAAALAVGAAVAVSFAGAPGAEAASPRLTVVKTLPGDFVGPLQFSVSGRTVAVADAFTSSLHLVGTAAPIATGPAPSEDQEESGDLAGVDVANGRIAYTTTTSGHTDTRLIVLRHGRRVLEADLGAYERRHNPDGGVAYGATDPSKVTPACADQLAKIHQQVRYRGLKDSHPYAVKGLRDGSWLVADAGGNDVLRVSARGRISLVAVLPAQTVSITPELAGGLGVPDCAGIAYRVEAVPTDVEADRHGVFVSTLPGGAGGVGSVYRIDHGRPTRIATGFAQATNLAVTPSGRVYVAELGVGIFQATRSGPVQVAALPGAAGVEYANGRLYASVAPALAGEQAPGHVVVLG